ncbi:uncharacterized protein DNG_07270 [Cephalotrichum gorgonifer]|uniref:Prolyl 4-hydroxylase alpha subunit domain-containing protein n=1 Tax=Cephalotrichum gorgonifer TaxID=2041049 RepID=A0AAE8N4A9_9PEZI|nr:uncharacterized protein DNG_07270 [Cephalotrichum gorgonifer]
MAWTSTAATFSAGIAVALLAMTPSPFTTLRTSVLSPLTHLESSLWPPATTNTTTATGAALAPFVCSAHPYTTQIVSTEPLVIYIHDFLSPTEISTLLSLGADLFKPSTTTKRGRSTKDTSRTSWSAALPLSSDAVQCVLSRAEAFMGTMHAPGRDDIGAPQLVRYRPGQKFDLHHDWYPRPQRSMADGERGRDRRWNRPASFFAVLEDGCEGGETYFPHVRDVAPQERAAEGRFPWRAHEEGGLAFRPVAGNALFWVNLFANGTGDGRTRHAGLPVTDGVKTAMNIWPKQYVGKDAWEEMVSKEVTEKEGREGME